MRSDFLLHLEEIHKFLDEVVIKFDYFASFMNGLPAYVNRTDVNPDDPTTHPYYRILAGDTSLATEIIYGYDPDVNTYIPLSVAELAARPNLEVFYTMNSSNMRALLAKYPNDEYLIQRLFNPITDIDAAIAADDFTVLHTPSGILNTNEEDDLITFLIKFVKIYKDRWYINTFEYEDLYPILSWSNLWYLLPVALLTKRIDNLRTIKVHPFHIWEYLISRGYHNYKGYFSREQEHFLYRNDDFLKRNVGKKFVLDILHDVFLVPIRHTLKEKIIFCNTENSLGTGLKNPDILDKKGKDINFSTLTGFNTFLSQLYNQGYDTDNTSEYKDATLKDFELASCNTLGTKFLELISNNNNDKLMILMKVIMDILATLVNKDRIHYTINVISASTGREAYDIPIIVALNTMFYCIYASQQNIPVNTIQYYTTTTALPHDSLPVLPEMIRTFDLVYQIIGIMDVDEVLGDVPYPVDDIYNADSASVFISKHFDWLYSLIDQMDVVHDTPSHEAMRVVFETMVPPVDVISLPQPYTTFTDMFAAFPELSDLVNGLTEMSHFDELFLSVFDQLVPLGAGFAELAKDSSMGIVIDKIKELFTFLTSYNITFITNDIDHVDIYKLPAITNQIGKIECYSSIYSFGDTAVNFEQEIDFIQDSSSNIEDEIGMDADIHVHDTQVTIETSPPEFDQDEVFNGTMSTVNIYYFESGIELTTDGLSN